MLVEIMAPIDNLKEMNYTNNMLISFWSQVMSIGASALTR